MTVKPIVYFLCTGNSCRSQMADGFMKLLGGNKFEVYSAGLEAHGLNPRAVQVMKEAGVDISANTSDVINASGTGDLTTRQKLPAPRWKLWPNSVP